MMNKRTIRLLLSISSLLCVGDSIAANVLWGTTVTSKVDVIDNELSQNFEVIDSKLDVADSELDVISTDVGALTSCGVTPISSADIVGGTITITPGGSYCLVESVTAGISVNAHTVSLDLGGHTVFGSIYTIPGPDDITIQNGSIISDGDTAISVGNGSVRTEFKNLTIRAKGATAVIFNGSLWEMSHCTIITEAASTPGSTPGVAIYSGDPGDRLILHDCIISTGTGSDNPGGTGGNGGQVMDCYRTVGTEIYNCIITTGKGGDGATGGNGGLGISIRTSSRVTVRNCTFNLGAGGSPGGSSRLATMAASASEIYGFGNFAQTSGVGQVFSLTPGGPEAGILLDPYPPDGTQTNISQYGNYFVRYD